MSKPPLLVISEKAVNQNAMLILLSEHLMRLGRTGSLDKSDPVFLVAHELLEESTLLLLAISPILKAEADKLP